MWDIGISILADSGDPADLIRWLEHPSPPSFRRDVLKQLHKMRLVEYDTDERTVRLLPPGVTAAEELVARAP